MVMMPMIVRIITGTRGSLTVMAGDPFSISVQIMLFLPDRNAMFDLVNDVSAGPESGITMRRGHTDPDSNITHPKRSRTVHRNSMADLETGQSFLDNPLPFFYGEWGVSLIFQPIHRAPLIAVTDPPLEGAEPTGFRQMQPVPQTIQINGRFRHQKARHPPVTGGMNTT